MVIYVFRRFGNQEKALFPSTETVGWCNEELGTQCTLLHIQTRNALLASVQNRKEHVQVKCRSQCVWLFIDRFSYQIIFSQNKALVKSKNIIQVILANHNAQENDQNGVLSLEIPIESKINLPGSNVKYEEKKKKNVLTTRFAMTI